MITANLLGNPTKNTLRFEPDGKNGPFLAGALGQSFGSGEERKTDWFDFVAGDELATRLHAAIQSMEKGNVLRINGEVAPRRYKDKDEKEHRTYNVRVSDFEIVPKWEKGMVTNELSVAGTVSNIEEKQARNGAYAVVEVETDEKNKRKSTFRLFKDDAVRAFDQLKVGDQHTFSGKLGTYASERDGVKHKDPELRISSWGKDREQVRNAHDGRVLEEPIGKVEEFVSVLKAGAESGIVMSVADYEREAIDIGEHGINGPYDSREKAEGIAEYAPVSAYADGPTWQAGHGMTVTPAAPAIATPAAAPYVPGPNEKVIPRETLPYDMSGPIKGLSEDGKTVYLDLGRGSVLALEAARFDTVPSVGQNVTVSRDGDRETATEKQIENAHERDQSLERTA